MELSKDVSLLILVPPPEDVCSCPGDGDIFSDNDRFLSIPVPVFEMSKYMQNDANCTRDSVGPRID